MLVTVNDLATFMDIKFSLRQQDAVEYVLEGLEASIEAYLGRPISVQSFTEEIRLESNHVGVPMSSFFYNTSLDTTMSPITYTQPPTTVYLKNSPVVSVSSVTVSQPQTGTTQTMVQNRDYVVRKYGIDLYRGFADDLVEIEYTAGMDDPSATKLFKLMILRAATREVQNMHDDVVGVKDLEPRNVAPVETGFLETELMQMKRYRRVRIA
jgi:hypothetical protein